MRVAEVIGALSLAADLSSGLAAEKGLRTVLVATRLARLVGLTIEEQGTIFWVSALRLVGCLGFASEEAVFAAGDDNSMRKTLVLKKRAVGFKLSDGMEVPLELASSFEFAKQKSKLAGTIRGSYFVIKGEY